MSCFCRRRQAPEATEAWLDPQAQMWVRMILRMSSRKRWACNMLALRNAKAMPKNIDGPGKGLGCHLREPGCAKGRWGWREIPHQALL